ncbi:MAG: hypothetical protein DPW16_10830 [Chloroflexi bacterium]|nr:hypothetical protein [Chloroflexota bacterium]
MDDRRRETIQAMIGAFLVASLGSITLYSIANRGWLGKWGKYWATYVNRKHFILLASIFGPVYAWAIYKGAELAERSKSK